MPPKAKFTREEVVQAALRILRERGAEAVTAREIGIRLNSSARPIFTLFAGMDDVLRELTRAVRDVYNEYVAEGLKETPAFKGVGKAYIRFASEEPNLFRLLMMEETPADIRSVLPVLDENYTDILHSITSAYALDERTADEIYRHMWIYSHGIATLCTTRVCAFTAEETDAMLTEVFTALLIRAKSGGGK